MAHPNLSIVIPTHNRRELVLRALDSVLAQTQALQVVVVDDASSDGTAEAIRGRSEADPRIELVSSTRRNASAARNAGLARATGEFLCFLDSDDCWLPGSHAAAMAAFERHPELAFVSLEGSTPPGAEPRIDRVVAGDSPGWSHARFRDTPLVAESFPLPDGNSAPLLHGDFFPKILFGDLFYLSGLVMRREAALAAGPFNERFRYFNDWEFFARLCLVGPGAYLGHIGFLRDTGRADQISRGRPITTMARRQRYIVTSLARRPSAARYARVFANAADAANYRMARCLAATRHARWARAYFRRCLHRGHKPLRCLALLAGWPAAVPTW
ncbi:MAG TPA: glycosyltransferase family 2 protein [Rudaea sp.]|nr:glycosyltransferase family 2 protein [Rudaea sp.]